MRPIHFLATIAPFFAAPLLLQQFPALGIDAYLTFLTMSTLWALLIILLRTHRDGSPLELPLKNILLPKSLLTFLLLVIGAVELFLFFHFREMVQEEIFWGSITLLGVLSASLRFRELKKIPQALASSTLFATAVAYLSFLLTTGSWHREALLPSLGFGALFVSYQLALLLTEWSAQLPSATRQKNVRKQRRKAEYMLDELSVKQYSRIYSVSLPLPPVLFCSAAIIHYLPSHYMLLVFSLLVIREQVFTVRNLEDANPLPHTFLLRHEWYVALFLFLLVVCGLMS